MNKSRLGKNGRTRASHRVPMAYCPRCGLNVRVTGISRGDVRYAKHGVPHCNNSGEPVATEVMV